MATARKMLQTTIYVDKDKWKLGLQKLRSRNSNMAVWTRHQIDFLLREDYDEIQAKIDKEIAIRDAKKVLRNK